MLRRIWRVSAAVVGSTITFWKRRSKAPSFSIFLRYSSRVVAPIHCISPRANAGFSGFLCNSLRMERIRSSNWPRYFVPATTAVMSRATTRLSNKMRETFFWIILKASPSTIADFPTPGSPIRIGLFFLRRLRIWAKRSISFSLPTTGSKRPSSAAFVISVPKLSSTGVSLAGFFEAVCACCWRSSEPLPPDRGEDISSSSSSSGNPMPEFTSGCNVACSNTTVSLHQAIAYHQLLSSAELQSAALLQLNWCWVLTISR